MNSDPNANGLSENNSAENGPDDTAEPHSESDRTARSGEQLSKIREILFGEQITAQRSRFEQIESRMSHDFRALREDLTRQISAVEDRLLRKVEDLAQRLEAERDRREESIEQSARRLESNVSSSDQRIDHLDSQMTERLTSVTQDLQAEIEHQRRSLQAHLEDKLDAITDTLSREANERRVSADSERANLSALFANLSQQLQPVQASEAPTSDQASENEDA